MGQIFIKPAVDGHTVPFAFPKHKRVLKAEGESVSELDFHWARRLLHGDVVLADPPPDPAPAPAPQPAPAPAPAPAPQPAPAPAPAPAPQPAPAPAPPAKQGA